MLMKCFLYFQPDSVKARSDGKRLENVKNLTVYKIAYSAVDGKTEMKFM